MPSQSTLDNVSWLLEPFPNVGYPHGSFGRYAPVCFSRYYRWFHPAQIRTRNGRPKEVRWGELAAAMGMPLTGSSRFEDFKEARGHSGYERLAAPLAASPSSPSRRLLIKLLQRVSAVHTCNVVFDNSRDYLLPAELGFDTFQSKGITYTYGELILDQLEYLQVFPFFCWPRARSWIVITPADAQSSLVACQSDLADELVECSLEVIEVDPTDPVLL